MYIDDILNEQPHLNTSNDLYDRMRSFGGQDLMKRMLSIFETPEEARDWFYSKNYSLGYARPYDVCRDGKVESAFNALDAYERAEKGILA